MHEIAESEVPTVSGSLFSILDDVWHPQKLEKQIDATSVIAPNIFSISLMKYGFAMESGLVLNYVTKREGWIFQPSLELCLMAPSTVMLKRELLEQCGLFDEELPVCEDYDLWLRITAHHQVSFLNEALMTRSGGHADQLSRKYWGMDQIPRPILKKSWPMSLSERKMKWQQDVS